MDDVQLPRPGSFSSGGNPLRRGILEYIPDPESPMPNTPFGLEEIPVTVEEPWTQSTEDLLCAWKDEIKQESLQHRNAGYRLKYKFNLLNFCSVFWSSIILIVNGLTGCESDILGKSFSLSVNAIGLFINGLNATLNLGYKYRVHFEYEAKYLDLYLDIEHMLSRSLSFRVPADEFITEIRERKKTLSQAPEFPKSRFFFC